MTSQNFVTAEERILARRHLQAVDLQTRLEAQKSIQATSVLARLPFPLGKLGRQSTEAWEIMRGREGTRPAYRVGQVDAELLDEELLNLLKGQVGEGLKLFGSHLRDEWSSEILLVLRTVLFKFTIWDHNASYGASLQNLKYTDARVKGLVPAIPSRWQKAWYGMFSVGGRYAWTKWENWLAEREGGYEEPSAIVRLFSRLSSLISTSHSIAAFVSFLIFLLNGRYRTLLDRILRLRLVAPTNQVGREVSFEYLNRQLVWHAFTEFLLFLLPLVGISRWRKWIRRAWRQMKAIFETSGIEGEDATASNGEFAFLPERTCAICYQDQNPTATSEDELLDVTGTSGGVVGSAQTDITNPYETIPCGCVYCFVCVATRLEREEAEGWICLRCGDLNKECKPWAGDVFVETMMHVSRKSVRFPQQDKAHIGNGIVLKDNQTLAEDEATSFDGVVKQMAEKIIPDEGYESREWAQQESDTSAVDIEIET